MFIRLPSYPSRFNAEPLPGACLFIETTNFDWFGQSGTIGLAIYADEAAAYGGKEPIERQTLVLPAAPAAGMPSLLGLVAANESVVAALMQALVAVILALPRFAGGTVAEPDVIARPSGQS